MSGFKKTLKNSGKIDKEVRDYYLCKNVYKCSPEDIENVKEYTLQLHREFYNAEKKEEYIKSKREQQRAEMKAKMKKK